MNCVVEGCDRSHKAKGYCNRHYRRFLAHGDPLGGKAGNGAVKTWVETVALVHTSDECLTWPFARVGNGYGRIHHNGRMMVASRYVCELVNGPRPSEDYEAAHECGKGHEGCVAPKHLTWKTRKDNQADRLRHGTDERGEKHHNSKLSAEDVMFIRSMRGKVTQDSLAEQFNTTQSNISVIQSGKNWGWMSDDSPHAANDNVRVGEAA